MLIGNRWKWSGALCELLKKKKNHYQLSLQNTGGEAHFTTPALSRQCDASQASSPAMMLREKPMDKTKGIICFRHISVWTLLNQCPITLKKKKSLPWEQSVNQVQVLGK